MSIVQSIKTDIVQKLQTIHPQKVILFGTFGTDKFQPGKSDIDLLIIQETDKKPIERFRDARLSLTDKYPFDIFVLTPEELEREKIQNFFFREILANGEVLYER